MTDDAIRQAVAWGQQLAVSKILEALRKDRPKPTGWRLVYESDDGMPTGMAWDPTMPALQQNGYDQAMKVVREFRIDPTEEPK